MRGGVERVDVGGARVLDGVLRGEGAEALGAPDEELVFVVGRLVDKVGLELGVGGDDNRGSLVAFAAGKSLEELLGEEGQVRVEHGEAAFESRVERLLGGLLLLLGALVEDGLRVLDVGVAEELVEVLVRHLSRQGELPLLEVLVDLLGTGRELVEDPSLGQRLLAALDDLRPGYEVAAKSAQGELCRLVDLVAESSVSGNRGHVEGDVSTTGCVSLFTRLVMSGCNVKLSIRTTRAIRSAYKLLA